MPLPREFHAAPRRSPARALHVGESMNANRIRTTLLAIALAVAVPGCDGGPDDGLRVSDVGDRAPSSETFRDAVDAVFPATVFIQVEARPEPRMRYHPFLGLQQVEPEGPPEIGSGSGVIFSEEGYVLTANHVVQQADRVLVVLPDGRQFEAQVVARDPGTDIAVIKIPAEDLPVAELGDSDDLMLGDWVLAVGSPLGLLRFTVTAGIVSAKGREVGILAQNIPAEQQAAPVESFIQTDAPINPGNSGGPLVALNGEVVGINVAILDPSRQGVWAGYGFAVPINLARRVARDLIRFGEVRRAYLGVNLDDLTPADVKVYGLDNAEGAEITMVGPESPASRAGLRMGDVVVGINGTEVDSRAELMAALAGLDPGSRTTLRVIRGDERIEVPVDLGEVRSGVRPEPQPEPEGPTRLGFAVSEAGGQVVVAAIQPYSAAARAGVAPGLVIRAVNGREVGSLRDFVAAVRGIEGVVSLIVSGGNGMQAIVNYEVRR